MVSKYIEKSKEILALELVNSETFSRLLLPIFRTILSEAIPTGGKSNEEIVKNAYRAEIVNNLLDIIVVKAEAARNNLDKLRADQQRQELKSPPREWIKMLTYYENQKGK